MPGVPTLKEGGIDVEADAWNGLIAPAKTPDAVIAKIHGVVVDALAEPTIREKLATQLMEPIPTTPAQFRAKIDADLARWSPIIKPLNLRTTYRASSLHHWRTPAIDIDGGAGDVGAEIRHEETSHVGEFLGPPDPAERDFLGARSHIVLERDASAFRGL